MELKQHKNLIIIGAALLLVLVWALWPAPVPVSAVVVERGPFQYFVEEEGRTRLRDTYTVSAPISGLLQRVELEPGDMVAAGDVVFRMEALPVPALDARAREQARESLAAARARLQAVTADHETRQAEAAFADSEYRRHARLFDEGLVSGTQMDRARAERDRSHAAERAARAAVEVVRFEVESARALVEVSEGSRSLADQPVLEVTAPVGGVILRRHRCCESVVNGGEAVLQIGDLRDLEVQVDLLSVDAVRVREGMRVLIDRWGGEGTLEATVRRVEPAGFTRVSALGVEEQRVPVMVVLDSPREAWIGLGEGYRVEARFILWEGADVLQIPTSALFRIDDAWHVYVIDGSRLRLRQVGIGYRSGLWTQVESGLDPGETVVVHPGDNLVEDLRVTTTTRVYR
jgi:HlyD family secretion protein